MENITFEILMQAHNDAQTNTEPLREKLKTVTAEIEKEMQAVASDFYTKFEKYLDIKLCDKNGKAIKKGDQIRKGSKEYKVLDRGLQFVFGTMLDNSRIEVSKVNPDGTLCKRKHSWYASGDLVDVEVKDSICL